MIFSIFSSGCTHAIFINSHATPISDTEISDKVDILGYYQIEDGIIQSINNLGNTLLISNTSTTTPITYDLNLLKLVGDQEYSLTNFSNTERKQTNGIFDTINSGVFYTQETKSTDGSVLLTQAIWSSMNREVTKTLSEKTENVSSQICLVDQNTIAFANDQNELIITTFEEKRQVYPLPSNYNIQELLYSEAQNTFFFLGNSGDLDATKNLYSLTLNDDDHKFTPVLIEKNVIDISLNSTSNQLAMIQAGNVGKIQLYDLSTHKITTLLKGKFYRLCFAQNDNMLIYTQILESTNSSLESIWIMDLDSKAIKQMTSPHNLVSKIISHPTNSSIFFSESGMESIDGDREYPKIYQLDYAF